MQSRDFPKPPPKGTIHIWRIDLTQDWNIPQYLSSDERERYSRFKLQLHRDRFARGRRALRLLIGRYLNKDTEAIQFEYGSSGKPKLKESPTNISLFFNASHCDSTMLVGFSTNGDIGIDVETNRDLPDEPKIVNRFFSKREILAYSSLPKALRSQGFINAWTRKEAILKATGEGLQRSLDSFSVSLDPRQPCEIQDFTSFKDESISWSLIDLSSPPCYTAAAAVQNEVSKVLLLDFTDSESKPHTLTYPQ